MSIEFSTECQQRVAALLAAEISQQMTEGTDLTEMELQLRRGLQEIGQRTLAEAINAQEAAYPTDEVACRCGKRARYVRRRRAKSITVFGDVWYERAYYVCSSCGQGQSPLDQRLGIAPGQISAGLGPLLALLGIETPFEKSSARMASELLLVEVSENSVRKETQLLGTLQTELETGWIAASQTLNVPQTIAKAGGKQAGRIYGGIDGTIVPIKKDWRELKTGTWYVVEATGNQADETIGEQKHLKAKQLSYYCDIAAAGEFRHLAWATACQRAVYQREEVVFVCDGAAWIWRLVDELFPKATQIVDWYHASEYLSPIAQAAYGSSPAGEEWLALQREDLWNGQIAAVIASCLAIAAQFPQASRLALNAVTYYRNNSKRMDYARLRQEGYQIGSGPTESGCKQIATLRLKQAGARWAVPGAVKTAKARAAWLSNEWSVLRQKRRELPLAA